VWAVQMILMFTLGRGDVFPTGDLGIQQAIAEIYSIKKTKKEFINQMQTIATKWSPYRTLACLYLWRYKDTQC